MGLYDQLEDIQVKCFFKNYYQSDANKSGIVYNSGSLKCYSIGDNVPYKCYHYDYGPNFILFNYISYDYDISFDIKNLDIIEVKDGKLCIVCSLGEYLKLVDYNDNLPLVMDFHGNVLHINTLNDLKEIACNWRYNFKKSCEVQLEELKKRGLPERLLSPKSFEENDLSKNMSYLSYLGEYNIALDLSNKYLQDFRSYWVDENKGISLDIIAPTDWGSLYQSLYDLDYSKLKKQILCRQFKKELESNGIDWLSNLNEYLLWCEYHEVDVDKDLIYSYI